MYENGIKLLVQKKKENTFQEFIINLSIYKCFFSHHTVKGIDIFM